MVFGPGQKLRGEPQAGGQARIAAITSRESLCPHARGGIRRVEGRFTTRFNGCLDPRPCSDGGEPDFSSGSDSRDLVLQGWSAGIGVEREFGRQLALSAEIRYTRYGTESWVTPFDEVGVRVPASVDAEDVSLSLGWARYF